MKVKKRERGDREGEMSRGLKQGGKTSEGLEWGIGRMGSFGDEFHCLILKYLEFLRLLRQVDQRLN